MPALRVYRSGMEAGPVTPKLRVFRSGLTGTVLVVPKLRVFRSGLTGTVAVVLNPIPAQTVEPGVTVTITPVLAGGGTPDSSSFRYISGDIVTLDTSTANLCRFTSPSVVDALKKPRQAQTVIEVTSTVGSVTSAPRQVTVTTLPQLRWVLNASRVFVGVTRIQLP